MASAEDPQFSLVGLEEDLTCSICLSTFTCPVTIPCGHNFCHDCLLATWKDSYSCPQCRTLFATKPELKKNTVLSTVVETFRSRVSRSEALVEESRPEQQQQQQQQQEEKKDVIRCDTCMEAEAAQTCLTCMASFCEEHLRPHRENPTFRLHQLSQPVGDLMERICPDHHKLMELFCTSHGRLICSFCLQQVHKGCSFSSPEDQRSLKQSELREKLSLLDGKIKKNETVICLVKDAEKKLKDSAANRKRAVSGEYQYMRDMLAREEQEALKSIDQEVETGQTKIRGMVAKFSDNVDKMSKAKERIHRLLGRSQTQSFLQTSFTLPQAVNYDPYAPRITLDSKKVMLSEAFAADMKNFLSQLLKQPVETRMQMLLRGNNTDTVAGENAQSAPWYTPSGPGNHPESEPRFPVAPPRLPRSHSPGAGLKAGQKKKPQKNNKSLQQNSENVGNKKLNKSMENLLELDNKDRGPRGCPAAAGPRDSPEISDIPPEMSSSEKRSELLKYGSVLTFDPRTAHKRIALSEGFTKASVSDEHTNYVDCPERFSVCSQVFASKGFSAGRHYWEVRLSSNNFVGVGLAYGSIDRKGPTSRLGRNDRSWCVEWFNVKLSAWHDSGETVLANPNPRRVGVLLDCEEGRATFYNVSDRAYPFHSFMYPFTEAVYPAFWIFSSGSFISLCKLQ